LNQWLVAAQDHREASKISRAPENLSNHTLCERLFETNHATLAFNPHHAPQKLVFTDRRIAAGQGIASGDEMAVDNAPKSMDCEFFLLMEQDYLTREKCIYAGTLDRHHVAWPHRGKHTASAYSQLDFSDRTGLSKNHLAPGLMARKGGVFLRYHRGNYEFFRLAWHWPSVVCTLPQANAMVSKTRSYRTSGLR
jgi:hypothetical protein